MPARLLWLLLGLALLLIVGASILTGDGAIVAAASLIVLFIALFVGINLFLARNKRDASSVANRDDPVPGAHLSPDPGGDDRPLGDTPEAHDEISPHDLPVGHPGRAAAERQARGSGGTTSGHAEGGAADADQRVGDRS